MTYITEQPEITIMRIQKRDLVIIPIMEPLLFSPLHFCEWLFDQRHQSSWSFGGLFCRHDAPPYFCSVRMSPHAAPPYSQLDMGVQEQVDALLQPVTTMTSLQDSNLWLLVLLPTSSPLPNPFSIILWIQAAVSMHVSSKVMFGNSCLHPPPPPFHRMFTVLAWNNRKGISPLVLMALSSHFHSSYEPLGLAEIVSKVALECVMTCNILSL